MGGRRGREKRVKKLESQEIKEKMMEWEEEKRKRRIKATMDKNGGGGEARDHQGGDRWGEEVPFNQPSLI